MKEPHRHVGVDRVMTSGSQGGEIVSALAWNARDVRLTPALGAIIPIFIIPLHGTVKTLNLYKLCAVWLLNLP